MNEILEEIKNKIGPMIELDCIDKGPVILSHVRYLLSEIEHLEEKLETIEADHDEEIRWTEEQVIREMTKEEE